MTRVWWETLAQYNSLQDTRITKKVYHESRKPQGHEYGMSSRDEKGYCKKKKVIVAAKTRVRHVEAAALSALWSLFS